MPYGAADRTPDLHKKWAPAAARSPFVGRESGRLSGLLTGVRIRAETSMGGGQGFDDLHHALPVVLPAGAGRALGAEMADEKLGQFPLMVASGCGLGLDGFFDRILVTDCKHLSKLLQIVPRNDKVRGAVKQA